MRYVLGLILLTLWGCTQSNDTMSQYFTDFSDQTVGQFPVGFTSRWDAASWVIIEDAGATGGKALRVVSNDQRSFLSYDAINADPDRADIELLIRGRFSNKAVSSSAQTRVVARASGDGTSETGYNVGYHSGYVSVLGYNGGSQLSIPGGQQAFDVDVNTWFWQRVRIIGDSLKIRAWTGGIGDEPETWNIEVTNTVITAPGWAGLFSFRTGGNVDFDLLGIGTGGDTAPHESVSSNRAPSISVGTIPTIQPGQSLTVPFSVTDLDGDPITSVAASLNDGVTAIDADTITDLGSGNYTATWNAVSAARYTLNLSASDGTDTAYDAVSVIVTHVSPSKDFEMASYGSIIASDDEITILPRVTFGSQYWWYAAKLTGMNGLQPSVRVHLTNHFQSAASSTATCRYAVWSDDYDPATGNGTWHDFDNRSFSSPYLTVSNNEPFTADTIYIAHYPIWPMSRVDGLVAQWLTSEYVTPAPSADASGVAATMTARVDPLGAPNTISLGGEKFYALKITDGAYGHEKPQVVWTTGNHAGETLGNLSLEGAVEWLLSADPDAAAFRKSFEVIVYPHVNPQGNRAGYYRSSPEDPAQNHNRDWGTTSLESHTALLGAFATDIDVNRIVAFVDFHCFGDMLNTGYSFVYDDVPTFSDNLTLVAALQVYAASTVAKTLDSTPLSEYIRNTYAAGSLRVAVTTEMGPRLDYALVSGHKLWGEHIARALMDMIEAGNFFLGPVMSGGVFDTEQVDSTDADGIAIAGTYRVYMRHDAGTEGPHTITIE